MKKSGRIKIVICFLLLLLSPAVYGQETNNKIKNEWIDYLATEIFPDREIDSILVAEVGDTTNPFKLVIIYRDSISGPQKVEAMQEMNEGESQGMTLAFTHTFGVGVYPNTSFIRDIFFEDLDGNGTKEMIVIEEGIWRCATLFEEYDELTGHVEKTYVTGSCELCGYSVFQQQVNSEVIELIDNEENEEWNCDEDVIKKYLIDKFAKKGQ